MQFCPVPHLLSSVTSLSMIRDSCLAIKELSVGSSSDDSGGVASDSSTCCTADLCCILVDYSKDKGLFLPCELPTSYTQRFVYIRSGPHLFGKYIRSSIAIQELSRHFFVSFSGLVRNLLSIS